MSLFASEHNVWRLGRKKTRSPAVAERADRTCTYLFTVL